MVLGGLAVREARVGWGLLDSRERRDQKVVRAGLAAQEEQVELEEQEELGRQV